MVHSKHHKYIKTKGKVRERNKRRRVGRLREEDKEREWAKKHRDEQQKRKVALCLLKGQIEKKSQDNLL